MATKTALEEALQKFPGVTDVQVVGNGRLVATLVSSTFGDEDEAERQARVWEHLSSTLGDAQMQNIEFIFTRAPGEPSSG